MYHIKKSWKEIKKSLLNQKLLIYRLLDIYRLKMANQCRISGERRGRHGPPRATQFWGRHIDCINNKILLVNTI